MKCYNIIMTYILIIKLEQRFCYIKNHFVVILLLYWVSTLKINNQQIFWVIKSEISHICLGIFEKQSEVHFCIMCFFSNFVYSHFTFRGLLILVLIVDRISWKSNNHSIFNWMTKWNWYQVIKLFWIFIEFLVSLK